MDMKPEMMELHVNDIRSNPYQARKQFNQGKLQLLADSIKEIGINTPIQLVWNNNGDEKKATIQDGERRFRAFKLAGYKKLKYGRDYIITKVKNDDELEHRGLIANCMREDLRPSEKATAFMQLLKHRGIKKIDVAINAVTRAKDYVDNDFISEPSSRNFFIPKETVKQVAKDMKMIGASGTNAVDLLHILRLPKDIQNKIIFASPNSKIYKEKVKIGRHGKLVKREGNDRGDFIPMTFGKHLARLENEKIIRFLLRKALENNWTARKIQIIVNDYLSSHLTAEKYIEVYSNGCKSSIRSIQKRREEIDHVITDMDNFASMLTSFRTINLFALADGFKQKMFLVSGVGLRQATIRLKNALDDILLNSKKLAKLKEEEREELIKLPFRVKMTQQPHMKAKAFRFSIPKELGEKLKIEYGDEVEIQINAIIKGE